MEIFQWKKISNFPFLRSQLWGLPKDCSWTWWTHTNTGSVKVKGYMPNLLLYSRMSCTRLTGSFAFPFLTDSKSHWPKRVKHRAPVRDTAQGLHASLYACSMLMTSWALCQLGTKWSKSSHWRSQQSTVAGSSRYDLSNEDCWVRRRRSPNSWIWGTSFFQRSQCSNCQWNQISVLHSELP